MGERTPRVLDLFAGCGGLTQGFSEAGFRSVGAVDLDRDAAATWEVNHGSRVHVGDMADWSQGSLPFAEVIVGGPPCQGFSALGKRDVKDPRNTLWRHLVHVVERVRPAFFVLENVPGFLDGPQFAALRNEIGERGALRGFELEVHILDAQDYGAGQARRRAVVVGRPRGMRELGHPPTVPRVTLRDVLRGVELQPPTGAFPARKVKLSDGYVPGVFESSELHVRWEPSQVSLERYRAIPPGGGRKDLPAHLRYPAWMGSYKGAGDVLGRLRWDRPSVTIRTQFHRPEKGRFLHPDEHRPITHYEAALLQGFPPDYRWCGTRTSIARQIGNAVPVTLARAIANGLKAALH